MSCQRCCLVCDRVLNKPHLSNAISIVFWCTVIVSVYFLVLFIGWATMMVVAVIEDDLNKNCWNSTPFWSCFWRGLASVVVAITAGFILFGIGYGIYRLCLVVKALCREIEE